MSEENIRREITEPRERVVKLEVKIAELAKRMEISPTTQKNSTITRKNKQANQHSDNDISMNILTSEIFLNKLTEHKEEIEQLIKEIKIMKTKRVILELFLSASIFPVFRVYSRFAI